MALKCNTCINSRIIVSENDYIYECTLSSRKAVDCMIYGYNKYIKEGETKMATEQKHKERSIRSRNNSKSGLAAMNYNSNLKTMTQKRIKDARKSGDR